MTAHGKFPPYKYEELPTTFKDTDGNEHNVDDIISYTQINDKNKYNRLTCLKNLNNYTSFGGMVDILKNEQKKMTSEEERSGNDKKRKARNAE